MITHRDEYTNVKQGVYKSLRFSTGNNQPDPATHPLKVTAVLRIRTRSCHKENLHRL